MDPSGVQGSRRRPVLFSLFAFIGWGGLTVFLIFYVFRHVDLRPRVDENFFFSSNDPQLQEDRKISQMFLRGQQIILSAGGDIHSQDYLRKVGDLTAALSAIPQVDSVQSLTHGPGNTDDALKSPLWKRFLFSNDKKASFIYVFMKRNVSVEAGVLKIEKIRRRFESPDFPIMISGAPYIVELISRNLLHDLKTFSIAALCVFGLSGLLISRSIAMVLGTLIACTNASALTLILAHSFGIPIGLLTANLFTIVFVLTLTHMVFMTFNWRHIVREKEAGVEKAWLKAVRVTLFPSFLSMLTELFGFLSLLFVPATPLRQLGLSGVIGTVAAFSSAYVIYPFFLRMQKPRAPDGEAGSGALKASSFFKNRQGWIVAAVLLATVAASTGIWKLDTNPSLFSYFKKGGELRNSLEYIDRNGGSIPLNIVLAKPSGAPFDMSKDYQRLRRLQGTLERDPAVGSIMSLPLLLAEAKRSFLASLIPINWLLKLLESPILGKTAIYYITKDRTKSASKYSIYILPPVLVSSMLSDYISCDTAYSCTDSCSYGGASSGKYADHSPSDSANTCAAKSRLLCSGHSITPRCKKKDKNDKNDGNVFHLEPPLP